MRQFLPIRIKEAYTADVWNRLVEIKDKWDPENWFHMNQNIRPSVKQKGTK